MKATSLATCATILSCAAAVLCVLQTSNSFVGLGQGLLLGTAILVGNEIYCRRKSRKDQK